MMPKRAGSSVSVNSVSLVRTRASSIPGIGGTKARAPVAITARAKRSVFPATSTVSGPEKLALPMKTSMPSSVKRRAES